MALCIADSEAPHVTNSLVPVEDHQGLYDSSFGGDPTTPESHRGWDPTTPSEAEVAKMFEVVRTSPAFADCVLHKAAAAKNMSVAQVLAVLGGEKRSDERVRMRATIKKVRRIIATTMATRKLERERRLGRRSSEVRCSPQPVLKASSSGRRVSLETDQMAKRKIGE